MIDHRLTSHHLLIHPADLKELRSDIWCEEPVPAILKKNKKNVHVDFVYRGSHIRELEKKSYNLQYRRPKIVQGTRELHLNAEFKDPSMMRNKLSLDFFEKLGILSPATRFITLYINTKYEGVYLELESVDEQFLNKRGLDEGAIYYAVDDDANFSLMSEIDGDVKKNLLLGYEQKIGTKEDAVALEDFIYKINSTKPAEFEQMISQSLHVQDYLTWLAGIVCLQNFDGFVHNYALYYNRKTRLFHIIPWDYDATWGRDVNGKIMHHEYVRIEGFNTLTGRLLAVPTYRKMYREIMSSILNNIFTTDYMEPIIQDTHAQIRPYLEKDPYVKSSLELLDKEPTYISKFIQKRRAYLLEQMQRL
ncbi:CotH kinase family protein [Bacillus sp. 2205SS5-2]|uniref:CotH kinase family protein n=1 Tax=Bacillus sp. 2205SS5-2 TaxID=3109031 RepID=UPI0030047469